MKTLLVAAGLVLLVIGIGVFAYGYANPIADSKTETSTSTDTLIKTNRVVDAGGLWAPGGLVLKQGTVVNGQLSVSDYAPSGGPIFFYVEDEPSFITWGGCSPCAAPTILNQTASASGTYSFTWTVPSTGSYYFVMDNEYYANDATASFTLSATTTTTTITTTYSPNYMLDYAGAGLLVLGGIALAAGLVMSGPKPSSSK